MENTKIKVAKFGGSSLADAALFRKVKEILESDPARRYVVPSAPGRRSSEDEKVTDLLYCCYGRAVNGENYKEVLERIVFFHKKTLYTASHLYTEFFIHYYLAD